MPLTNISIENFTVFSKIEIPFSKGINVFIGGNGMGKTHLLKILYAFCERPKAKEHFERQHKDSQNMNGESLRPKFNEIEMQGFPFILSRCFFVNQGNALFRDKKAYQTVEIVQDDNFKFRMDYPPSANPVFESSTIVLAGREQETNAVFIPVAEMLSHSKGFLELNSKYEMPFDQTQVDILVNAGLPETREISPLCTALLEKIGKIIDGEVLYENGKYYIIKKSGLKVEFSLEASGYQKFGLLWKLLRNGLLEKGSVLFWDEPEASLNPELMSVLVDILLELQRNGVQIFVATHSEILARNFAAACKDNNEVMFCALYKDGEQVKVEMNDRFDLLERNKLTDARVDVYHKELEKGLDND
jgi:AAA15 family ATPase/GTPase